MDISEYGFIYPNWKIKALEYGDIYLENNNYTMLIERKEYKDYINSIGDVLKNRLFKMKQNADIVMLLIEDSPNVINEKVGYYVGNKFFGVNTKTYNNFMLSRGIDGVIIFPTINLKHTIISILNFYDYLGKIDKRRIAKPSSNMEMLSLFPGVGRKKATILSKKYKNMADALNHWEEWISEKDKFKFYGEW